MFQKFNLEINSFYFIVCLDINGIVFEIIIGVNDGIKGVVKFGLDFYRYVYVLFFLS